MACPSCDHTMHRVGVTADQDGAGVFWCPRCGTLRTAGRFEGDDVPKLVTRCREFQQALTNPATGAVGANLRLLWHTEGIDASICPPEQRPT